MGIYDNLPARATVDAEHLLHTVLAGEMPQGVNVTFAPEAEQLDFANLPDTEYPMVVLTMVDGGDIANGDYKDGDEWDVGVVCLDVNREAPGEESSHVNASRLSDFVLQRLYSLARRQATAPGIGSIHSVENTARPKREMTVSAGDRQRTMFSARYTVTFRPPR